MKTLTSMLTILFVVTFLIPSVSGQDKEKQKEQSLEGQTIKILREMGSEEIERDRERTAELKRRLEKFIQSRPSRREPVRKPIEAPKRRPDTTPVRQVAKKPASDATVVQASLSVPEAEEFDAQVDKQVESAKRIKWFEQKFAELEAKFDQLKQEWQKFRNPEQDGLSSQTAGK